MYPRETLLAVAQEGARIRAVARVISDVMSVGHGPTDADIVGSDDVSQALRLVANSIPDAPRSIVIVACSETARHAARAVVSLIPAPSVPIVVTEQLPRYVGATDCVVVLTPDPADRAAEEALVRCRRVRAMAAVAAPLSGPVADAARVYALVSPDLPGGGEESWGRYVATVAGACGLVGEIVVQGVLEYAADAVDRDMEGNAPGRDETVNPARQLGMRMKDHRVVIAGDGATRHVASFAATCLLRHGIAAATAETTELARSYSAVQRGTSVDVESASARECRAGGADASIFYDPFLDAPAAQPVAAVVVPGVDDSGVSNGDSSRGMGIGDGLVTAYPSTEKLGTLNRYFDAQSVTVVDLTSSDLHSVVAYICVLGARLAAAAAYVTVQDD